MEEEEEVVKAQEVEKVQEEEVQEEERGGGRERRSCRRREEEDHQLGLLRAPVSSHGSQTRKLDINLNTGSTLTAGVAGDWRVLSITRYYKQLDTGLCNSPY